jgi:SOS-response transcriptional repressor LexA
MAKQGELDGNIRSNLTMTMARRGLTQRAVAELAGMKPQVLNAYMTKKRGFGRATIERLARALNVSESYLIGGEATAAVDAFEAVMDRGVFGAKTPIVSLAQAAEWDKFTNVHGDGYASGWLPFRLRGRNDIAIRVEDDSMEPEFKTGSIVVLGESEGDPDGKYVLARVDKEVLLRGYRKFEHGVVLTPLNTAYAVRVIINKDLHRLHVAAVAVGQVRLYDG